MAKQKVYTVKRAFHRGGKYYTRQNAHEIGDLQPKEIKDLIASGRITEDEVDAPRGSAAEPAVPATPEKGK